MFGSVKLIHGDATVRGFNPSFAGPASFQCTANDKTTTANSASATPQSGSSIVLRGVGEDVVVYMCVGS